MGDYIGAYDGKGYQFQVDEAHRLADNLRTEATITNGIIRWNSNGQVPPTECVALAAHIGLPIDVEACTAARDTEISAFLEEYRRNNDRPASAEERAEMRAAFGPGSRVVNVVTGRVTQL